VRGRDDPVALYGYQGDAVAHPWIFDELPGLASE
jgi:hypothetical protein